jgi:hypothetical protein
MNNSGIMKTCTKCCETKNIELFAKIGGCNRVDYRARCKVCYNKQLCEKKLLRKGQVDGRIRIKPEQINRIKELIEIEHNPVRQVARAFNIEYRAFHAYIKRHGIYKTKNQGAENNSQQINQLVESN